MPPAMFHERKRKHKRGLLTHDWSDEQGQKDKTQKRPGEKHGHERDRDHRKGHGAQKKVSLGRRGSEESSGLSTCLRAGRLLKYCKKKQKTKKKLNIRHAGREKS